MGVPEINKRIRQIIDYYTNSVVKKFAESIGIQQQTVNRLFVIDNRTGKYPVATTDILQKISEMYDSIDTNWLLTGQGEMLKTDKPIYMNLEKESQSRHLIPFYDDVRTKGGGGGSNLYDIENAKEPTEYINTGDWFNNATAAMRHYGDSMIEYPPGSILALREIHDFRLIIPGKDYVIETSEDRVTKKVRLIKDGIKAYSTNEETYKDGELIHQPFDIPFELIQKISEVIGYVVKKGSGTMVYANNNNK
jgi:hypothetical protein